MPRDEAPRLQPEGRAKEQQVAEHDPSDDDGANDATSLGYLTERNKLRASMVTLVTAMLVLVGTLLSAWSLRKPLDRCVEQRVDESLRVPPPTEKGPGDCTLYRDVVFSIAASGGPDSPLCKKLERALTIMSAYMPHPHCHESLAREFLRKCVAPQKSPVVREVGSLPTIEESAVIEHFPTNRPVTMGPREDAEANQQQRSAQDPTGTSHKPQNIQPDQASVRPSPPPTSTLTCDPPTEPDESHEELLDLSSNVGTRVFPNARSGDSLRSARLFDVLWQSDQMLKSVASGVANAPLTHADGALGHEAYQAPTGLLDSPMQDLGDRERSYDTDAAAFQAELVALRTQALSIRMDVLGFAASSPQMEQADVDGDGFTEESAVPLAGDVNVAADDAPSRAHIALVDPSTGAAHRVRPNGNSRWHASVSDLRLRTRESFDVRALRTYDALGRTFGPIGPTPGRVDRLKSFGSYGRDTSREVELTHDELGNLEPKSSDDFGLVYRDGATDALVVFDDSGRATHAGTQARPNNQLWRHTGTSQDYGLRFDYRADAVGDALSGGSDAELVLARRDSRGFAVSIGSMYSHQDGVEPLRFASSDARRIAHALAAIGFESRLLDDDRATLDLIIQAFNTAANSSRETDTLIVYFSGHSVTDNRGQIGLLLPGRTAPTVLPLATLEVYLEAYRGRIVLILDGCLKVSSQHKQFPLPPRRFRKHITVLSGAVVGGSALESPTLRSGLFTYGLVEYLDNLITQRRAARTQPQLDLFELFTSAARETTYLANRLYARSQVPALLVPTWESPTHRHP